MLRNSLGPTIDVVSDVEHLWLVEEIVALGCRACADLDSGAIKSWETLQPQETRREGFVPMTGSITDPVLEPWCELQFFPALIIPTRRYVPAIYLIIRSRSIRNHPRFIISPIACSRSAGDILRLLSRRCNRIDAPLGLWCTRPSFALTGLAFNKLVRRILTQRDKAAG